MVNLINQIKEMGTASFILLLIILVLAIKEGIGLYTYFKNTIKEKVTDKKNNDNLYNEIQKLTTTMNEIKNQQDESKKLVDILIQSDIEDIRSWIVTQYHIYKENPDKVLDDFTMDCIEKRFACYEKEGGNSYIHDLVYELRQLHK